MFPNSLNNLFYSKEPEKYVYTLNDMEFEKTWTLYFNAIFCDYSEFVEKCNENMNQNSSKKCESTLDDINKTTIPKMWTNDLNTFSDEYKKFKKSRLDECRSM